MANAFELVKRHIESLVDDNAEWQTLIADDLIWELAYAHSLGHPVRLTGREEVLRHVAWFVGAVKNFRFFDARIYQWADPNMAVAEARAKGTINATGRKYEQEYVFFLWAAGGKIARIREYLDPVRAASAFGAQVQYLTP